MPKGKPNILVIWGDDIVISNLSCYSDALMGYRTPNIDRIANEGMRSTDSFTRKRMETCDDEFVAAAANFIQRQRNRRKPFFC